jgi:hypothetical protein
MVTPMRPIEQVLCEHDLAVLIPVREAELAGWLRGCRRDISLECFAEVCLSNVSLKPVRLD